MYFLSFFHSKKTEEIPKLREVLRSLNLNHTNKVASQYFTSATGILSLIQTSKADNAKMVSVTINKGVLLLSVN